MEWLPPLSLIISIIALGYALYVDRLSERRYQEDKAERARQREINSSQHE